ncbi:unnamed protein product [Mucor hiemalis]
MGVQGLWSLLGPAARPTQLESLRQKRIAVDASICIYQFMRTMRDREGNPLKNGHLLGFFRRLCKLLFYDIKPVFVFDGGAPALKRSTIRERRKRREGVKINMRATAKKLLSAQVKSRLLLEQDRKQRGESDNAEEEENYVYVEQLEKTAEVLRNNRKLDQYELPEVDSKTLISKLDPRLASAEELQNFVDEFNVADLDIDSDTFQSLPPEVQYEVIQDLKLKSRQTSWARLDEMVRGSKTALDFSKHQIKLLKHRNTMTQRMMQMNTVAGGESESIPTRVAGERGRQYVLYKNESLDEGLGWKLPGLSAEEPVIIDNHPEPKLEVLDKEESPSLEGEDKVKAAMEKNPKLAALFSGFLSEDDDSENEGVDMEEVSVGKEDDEPLFVESTHVEEPSLLSDIRAYMEDEDDDAAINQVISKMYKEEFVTIDNDQVEEKDSDILSLTADDFLKLWQSRMPDAFLYLHSFNDEHKRLLETAMKEKDLTVLQSDLNSVRKQFGKTNEGDELALGSLHFHETFLESVISWKCENIEKSPSVVHEIDEVVSVPEPLMNFRASPVLSKTIVVEDDEDIVLSDDEDEDIQFLPTTSTGTNNPPITEKRDGTHHPVNIDISQSRLNTSSNLNVERTRINEDVKETLDTKLPIDDDIADSIDDEIEEIEESIISTDALPNTEAIPSIEVTETETRGYNSEDELEGETQGEEDEFARFVSDIASKHLDDVRDDLHRDMKQLNDQQRKDMGNSDDVTDQMVQDIQELLKLFGIPFIVSPMEAEAQCAELESLQLIDGTITDDSDVFLFGASRVYKNMFNQQRFVECYMSRDIEREMLLSRTTLIQLAFLLGSDYTDGIPRVGPVAAMEILSEFSAQNEEDEEDSVEGPLVRFKEWYNGGVDTTAFQKKFRKSHADIDIPDDFPNPLVQQAYFHPLVDHSDQKFVWGQPQLDSLRIFLTEAFGWSVEKADQVLLPVLREMNSKKVLCILLTLNIH